MPTHLQEKSIKITNADTPYSASLTRVILADATNGNITINLPSLDEDNNTMYTIKKIDSTSNTITIDGNSTETIDGSETQVISSQYVSLSLTSSTNEWHII